MGRCRRSPSGHWRAGHRRNSSPTLVAFGGDSHAILTRNFGDRFVVVKAPHYSMYIGRAEYRRTSGELARFRSDGPGS